MLGLNINIPKDQVLYIIHYCQTLTAKLYSPESKLSDFDNCVRISHLFLSRRQFHINKSIVRSIFVNNQLDAQFFFFRICFFQFSTCFEHPCAHHQENQLY
jgi:hypothetical protein